MRDPSSRHGGIRMTGLFGLPQFHSIMKKRRLKPAERKSRRRTRRIPRSHNGKAAVNAALLAPNGSYDSPEFLKRGCYRDEPFTCRDCGREEIWTASQQKWWFEIAKGEVFTRASRCRNCRRRERERRNEARRVHLGGLAAKRTKADREPA